MGRGEGGGGIGPFDSLQSMAIGLLILAVIFMVVPLIGGSFEANMPSLGATSQWNATYNTKLTSGSTFWTGLSPFLYLAALVFIVFAILMYLRGR
jgi:hypothetical protein